MKISILIPTLDERRHLYQRLIGILKSDIGYDSSLIEILSDSRGRYCSIGQKRNDLLKSAKGDYVVFIDDDDIVCTDYIAQLLKGIEGNPDCCSLKGLMTTNNLNPEAFEHSIKYFEYKTTENKIKYERYPNHLNCIKASIAKQFKFPETNFGEDTDWATQIFKSGLIKTEYYISKTIYYYQYKNKK